MLTSCTTKRALVSGEHGRRNDRGWLLVFVLSGAGLGCGAGPGAGDPLLTSLAPDVHWSVGGAGGPFAFSPDGATVATGGPVRIQLLSAADGSLIRSLRLESRADAAAFSPDGTLLAAGGFGTTRNLRMFRVSDGRLLFQKTAHNNGTMAIAFSPAAAQFATGGRDKFTANTKIWSNDGTLVRSLNDGARVFGVAYSPDGANLASNASGTIHIWRVSDGALLRTMTSTSTHAIAYSPDGALLTTGRDLFQASTGAHLRTFAWPSSGSVVSAAFTRDGGEVVVGGEDFTSGVDVATIRYFRVSDGATLVTFDAVGGDSAYVEAVAISPDGASLGYAVATDQVSALATSPF
jgi:WD40 repeat protein